LSIRVLYKFSSNSRHLPFFFFFFLLLLFENLAQIPIEMQTFLLQCLYLWARQAAIAFVSEQSSDTEDIGQGFSLGTILLFTSWIKGSNGKRQ